MHLRFSYQRAGRCHETRHAQEVMEALGITYQQATVQTIFDEWWFWNCENVPAHLPEYITELLVTPHKAIGYGLSKDEADRIVAGNIRL